MNHDVASVDPTFYRMIGELTGEVRGLKDSLDFRSRQTEVQVGEIRADIRTGKHEFNNQRMKMRALETLVNHEVVDVRERVESVERRIDTLDARVTRGERPIEELMTLRVRGLAWLGGVSAGAGVLWLFIGPRIVTVVHWALSSAPENLK